MPGISKKLCVVGEKKRKREGKKTDRHMECYSGWFRGFSWIKNCDIIAMAPDHLVFPG